MHHGPYEGRPHGSPNPPAPRGRGFAWWTLPIILLCFAGLFYAFRIADGHLAAYDRFNAMRAALAEDVFYGPTAIDGIPLAGLSRAEAAALLDAQQQETDSGFSITLTAGEEVFRLGAGEVPMARNTQELLDKAYMIGRIGTLEERYRQIQTLKTPVELQTETTYDKAAIKRFTDRVAQSLKKEGRDATVVAFDVAQRSFAFSDEATGQWVDGERLYQSVIEKLDLNIYSVSLQVPVEILPPQVTKAQLESSYTRVASFTTKTTSDENRNTNIRLGAEAINGQIIMPGETISFNDTTGQRTREKGYQEAGAIENGRTVQEVGGGICQVSTTLFNALVRAGAEIVRRTPHAWPSDYVERGEDATVDWPRLDLVMRNPTDAPMVILAGYQDRQVTVDIYGLSLGDGIAISLSSATVYTKQPTETVYTYNPLLPVGTTKLLKKPHTGYTVETYKVITQHGQEISRTKLYQSDYKMINEEYEYNDGVPPEGFESNI